MSARLKRQMAWFAAVPFVLTLMLTGCAGEKPADAASTEAGTAVQNEIWTCSMHPSIRQPEPGLCPVCNMDLIPADQDGDGPWSLTLSPAAQRLAEVETAPVVRKVVAHEVAMVGKVAFDEKRVSDITAWVSGRIDRLFVDFTGITVREGDHMVELYSPELVTAQQELRQAKRSVDSGPASLRAASKRRLNAARKKLDLLGLASHQIDAIEKRGQASDTLTIEAPMSGVVIKRHLNEGAYVQTGSPIYTVADLSRVWIVLDVYESELAWLRYGQKVEFEVGAYPGEVHEGKIVFIDPVLDPRTHTVKVRLDVANPDGRLKPDMFVSARAYAKISASGQTMDESLAGKWVCPMHPEVIKDGPAACDVCGMDIVPAERLGFVAGQPREVPLVIPRSAPLITGQRAVVYVADVETPGRYTGREIVLGPETPDHYVVLSGLAEGERVVVNGAFKIDSELQIRAKSSMMYAPAADPTPAARAQKLDVAPTFRAALTPLYQAYFDVQTALSLDDFATAQQALRALDTAWKALDTGALDARAMLTWQRLNVAEVIQRPAAAGDIATLREAFEPLSTAMYHVASKFGFSDELSIYRYHCPMAFDNRGADWLQRETGTANPYYGSMMFACGSQKEDLRAEAAEGATHAH
ncbi:efflux RND transporter periplasmic adaptor subunit [Acanthopleuribacter pedis]|uniref:Efflux RND transporter periplasmic adaptor subunit n=1 Tax=Acanthopleuribacter pedis TaxID=442870 RepID=A0A8J7QGS3_9BACT|nr:efflux RND transporter periplasmic adaptor subunit [Acanthopleuribacter pedis]MBO1319850.1 efflux RND transporter periplasmic adaptor subunit [Acanthopleuribacter pedis]